MISSEKTNKLREKFNPEGSDLRRQQLLMLDMLKQIDEFCKKHHIRYWIAAGTLLGAYRHGGFIPWDDDLDIEMLKKDYKKFYNLKDIFEKETGLKIQNFESDPEYIAPFPKIRHLKTELFETNHYDIYYKFRGIYIDIFIREKSSKLTTFVTHVLQYGAYNVTKIKNKSVRRGIKNFLYVLLHYAIFPFFNFFDKIFNSSQKIRHVKGSGFYDFFTYEEVFPLKEIRFEDTWFPAPFNCDAYLTHLYGDYMQLPSVEELHPHYTKIVFEKSNLSNS